MSSKSGQSIIELLIAIGIFVLMASAALLLFFGGQSLSIDSSNAQQALDYASEGQEAVRSVAHRDWDELVNGEHGIVYQSGQWQFSGASTDKEIFTRTIFIDDVDANTKRASTTVTWQLSANRIQNIELVQYLTQWENPLVGGCKTDPISGDWYNPVVLGSTDLGPGNEGTDVIAALPYVYMSAEASSASKPDVFVIDASNVADPQVVRSVDIGAKGVNALYLNGSFLYGSSDGNNKELVVLNVGDPVNMSEATSLDLIGDADATAIFGIENAVYIGRVNNSSAELVVIDVSDPLNPFVATSFEIGGKVNGLSATSHKLYVSTDRSDKDVWIYDIENPTAPVLLTTYDLPVGDTILGVGFRLPGDILAGGSNQLWVLGATTTDSIYVRDSIETGGSSNDVACVADNLAFLATNNSTKEFMIVDISNPDDIKEVAFFNFPQVGTGMDFAQNMVFLSVRSNDALRIIGPGP
jgi:type II secretory pathway pseudopilin PulG